MNLSNIAMQCVLIWPGHNWLIRLFLHEVQKEFQSNNNNSWIVLRDKFLYYSNAKRCKYVGETKKREFPGSRNKKGKLRIRTTLQKAAGRLLPERIVFRWMKSIYETILSLMLRYKFLYVINGLGYIYPFDSRFPAELFHYESLLLKSWHDFGWFVFFKNFKLCKWTL